VKRKEKRTATKELAAFRESLEERRVRREEQRIASFEFREGLKLARKLLADEHKTQEARLAKELVESGKLDEITAAYRQGFLRDVTLEENE